MSEFYDSDIIIWAGRGGELTRAKFRNLDELETNMHLIADRVRASDVLDLPSSSDQVIQAALEPGAKKIYREIQNDYISDLGGSSAIVTAANAMVVTLRLAQLTGGYLRDEDNQVHEVSTAKRDALEDLLSDFREPLVVFGRFHSDLDAINLACQSAGLRASELSGRRNELEVWQSGGTEVLIAQVQAGSVGVDLTRSRAVVFYSLSYSLSEYLQARARVLRAGQNRNVIFTHLIAGPVDTNIYRALEARGSVVSAIVDHLSEELESKR
jgi:SNF2 family DNA or RNA helicase